MFLGLIARHLSSKVVESDISNEYLRFFYQKSDKKLKNLNKVKKCKEINKIKGLV